MEKDTRLTPRMIAQLFGVSEDQEEILYDSQTSEFSKKDEESYKKDNFVELEIDIPATGANNELLFPTLSIFFIGLLMIMIGVFLLIPVSVSIEQARNVGGLGYLIIGASVILSELIRINSTPNS
jgi:hypothetical protein